MYTFDLILIILVSIYTLFISVKILSLRKVNNQYQILQKNKPQNHDLIDLLNQKIPTVITGEVEDWFIFNENDEIVTEKLNTETLNDNTKKLCYIMPLVKKYDIQDYAQNHETTIQTQNNTRNFLVLLSGEISIYLLNPQQKSEVINNNNLKSNSKLKYMEVKLYSEQILHIPYQWHYAFKCHTPCKILEVNSETILTLPIKTVLDKF